MGDSTRGCTGHAQLMTQNRTLVQRGVQGADGGPVGAARLHRLREHALHDARQVRLCGHDVLHGGRQGKVRRSIDQSIDQSINR